MKKSHHHLSRRQFMKSSLMVGATALLPLPSVLGANEQINLAVIGCGTMGGGHIRNFPRLDGVKVVAVSDPDLHRMDEKTQKLRQPFAKHQDFRHILDDKDVDAVVIATPNHWHSLMAIMACQAGKHVYVQKPVSHSIWEGRQMVNAARKYNRIVQAGTQHRSCPAVIEAARDIQSGKYGQVQWVHCSKLGSRESIGKSSAPLEVPAHIDYNLWAGPAPATPVMRKQFHYDWHWQWNYGDGELGNWGVHYIDDLRHLLGWNDVPETVQAVGNRFHWDDDGQTPNMIMALYEHQDVKVVLDVRNLQDLSRPGGTRGAVYLGMRGGNHIQMEKGYMQISRGGGFAYDLDGEKLKQYVGDGGGAHEQNFIDAIRSGKASDLNCEIGEGHLSTVMCHQANVAFKLGHPVTEETVQAGMRRHDDALEAFEDMSAQITGMGVDLKRNHFIMGPKITYDNAAEHFTGEYSGEANALIKLTGRPGFEIPAVDV
ncbi:MAG: Gfo/Idh/MocA family oxidoreductase [Planctomycetes bacterium]|nr:Gfo/Idh/MocA family oxidoreductase [Planctomycetota bacterium]